MALSAALKAKSQPQETPLKIYIGDTVYLPVILSVDGVVQDLTSCTVTAKIEDAYGGSALATFTSTLPTPASGSILMQLAPATTSGLASLVTADGVQIGVWSATVTDATDVVTFMRGPVYGFKSL